MQYSYLIACSTWLDGYYNFDQCLLDPMRCTECPSVLLVVYLGLSTKYNLGVVLHDGAHRLDGLVHGHDAPEISPEGSSLDCLAMMPLTRRTLVT